MTDKKPDSLDFKNRDYKVVEHDPKWAEWFSILETQMQKVFEDCQPDMYHIGGTAVDGLPSQPILDMLIVVPDIHCLDRHLQDLKQFGYLIKHDYIGADTILAFKERDNTRLENIHVLPQGHKQIDDFLSVKEYWEEHPDEAGEYGGLKLELYKKFPKNYVSYRKDRDAWLDMKKKKDIKPWFKKQ